MVIVHEAGGDSTVRAAQSVSGGLVKVTAGGDNLLGRTGVPNVVLDASRPLRRFLISDVALSWVAGGTGSYTVTPINDPDMGAGVELALGADGSAMAWIDLTDAAGLAYLSSEDSITAHISAGTGTHALFGVRLDDATDFATTTNFSIANSPYSGCTDIATALDADHYAGSVSLSAGTLIKGIRLRLWNNSTATASKIRVFGITLNRVARKGTVLLDFDDAFLSQYTQAFRYMRTKGCVGSVAVIAETVGQVAGGKDAYDYCTLAQLKSMRESGWAMLTHGYLPHRTGLATQAAIVADVAANKAYVAAQFGEDGSRHYVLPAGQESEFTMPTLMAQGFETCRTTQMAMVPTLPTTSPYFIPSVQVSSFVGLVALKKWYDRAKKYGMTVRFQAHRIVTTVGADTQNEISIADFQAFIDYIATDVQSGAVWNPNIVEWFAQQ